MTAALQALTAQVVDYAGLFPPAKLPLNRVIHNYADYSVSPDCWMLGRLIIPLQKLDLLVNQVRSQHIHPSHPWHISCLLPRIEPNDDDTPDTLRNHWRKISEFNMAHVGQLEIDALEVAVDDVADILELASSLNQSRISPHTEVFVEVPYQTNCQQHLALLAQAKGIAWRAKIRTGGISADLFPTAEQVVSFIIAACQANIAFKATAGLHHPLRAEHPISYEIDCNQVVMHGFLNLIMATTFARAERLDRQQLVTLLEETNPIEFQFDESLASWRGVWVSRAEIEEMRRESFRSFGSCSFVEPVEDLQALGYLPEDTDEPIPLQT